MTAGKDAAWGKHVPDPDKISACKRINLALRWLVRNDGIVDIGLWKTLSPSRLYIPLDVHAGRTARALGLLERKSSDRKAVEKLTEKLREFCPEDPVKYDFALFGISSEFSRLSSFHETASHRRSQNTLQAYLRDFL
jgi:uncharacterized protein (TIGR02757 family)